MLEINKCPVCESNKFEPYLSCKDYTVSGLSFQIVSCLSCGFKFTNPRPDDSDIGKYYKAESYVSHSNTKQGLINKLYHIVRQRTLKQKLNLISSYVSRGTILDYGCGTGLFLKTCKNAGWLTYGYEPDYEARKIASEGQMPVFDNKEDLSKNLFDVITLWHVLEHVTDLHETLSFFKEHLSDKGALIIAVPNYCSYDAKFYKEFWAGYDVPRHIYHFNLSSIRELLKKTGFILVETKPMKFDSFYVSMLSEKYKTGTINYFKAFLTGLKSNLKAKSASGYSSVIYVFKKEL